MGGISVCRTRRVDSHLIGINFLVRPVRLNRLVSISDGMNEFLSLLDCTRSNSGDLMHHIVNITAVTSMIRVRITKLMAAHSRLGVHK